MSWPALPVFVKVAGRPVILIGDGEAADAKRRLLERAGAVVIEEGADARLAIVALEDEGAAIAATARLKARGILVNVVDRPALCDFTLPAIVDRSPVLVAIGTGGVSAGLAAALRQRLEGLLPAGMGRTAEALQSQRANLRTRYPNGAERRRAISAALAEGGTMDLLRSPGEGLGAVAEVPQPGPGLRRGGEERFVLTSADPDDLTLRQARALADADRVIHTAAVPAAILDRARADAPRIVAAAAPLDIEPGLTVWLEMA